jgi:hypothetical protein
MHLGFSQQVSNVSPHKEKPITQEQFQRIARKEMRKGGFSHREATERAGLERAIDGGKNFVIHAPQSLYVSGGIPDMKPPQYEPFVPPTVGNTFHSPTFRPHFVTTPYSERIRQEREYQRLLLRQKLIEEIQKGG